MNGAVEADAGSRRDTPRWGFVLLAAWIGASTLLGRSFTALVPARADSAIFAYVGEGWRQGRPPYANGWENKPPGVFALDALVFAVFGRSFVALALVEAVCLLGSIFALYLILRRWGAPQSAAGIGAAAAAAGLNLSYYNAGGNLTETYLILPAALSILCFSRTFPRVSVRWALAAGVMAGLASQFKTPGLGPLAAMITFTFCGWAILRLFDLRAAILASLAGILGAVLSWVPAVLYFRHEGLLYDLADATLLHNLSYGATSYAKRQFFSRTVFTPLSRLQFVAPLVVCVLIGLILIADMMRRRRRPTEGALVHWPAALLLAVSWAGFDYVGALAGGKNHRHYFLPLILSASVVAGVVCWRVIAGVPDRRLVPAILAALVVGPMALVQLSDVPLAREYALRRVPPEPWQGMATQLARMKESGDTLFTWSFQPEIFLATAMRSPVRFLDASHADDSPAADAEFGRVLRGPLRSNPPTYVVVGPRTGDEADDPREPYFKEFRDWVSAVYDPVFRQGNLVLYKARRGR